MLRIFYILICITLCFCYEYIEENQRFKKRNRNSETINEKRQKSKLVFDVASFLRNTPREKSDDYERFAYYKKKNRQARIQSDYYYETPLNENIKKRDENTNYLNADTDLDSTDSDSDSDSLSQSKDEDNNLNEESSMITENDGEIVANEAKNERIELLIDRDLIQNPEKRCAFKDMKVPFFSHKPSTAKTQKNKIVCINCAKPYPSFALKDEDPKTKQLSKQMKRNYINLCPKCIRKRLKIRRREPESPNRIHNSREFYQYVTTQGIQNDRLKIENLNNDRSKRDECEDRERRLKELQEVEKKVDHVQITIPRFNAVSLKLDNEHNELIQSK